MAKGCSRSLQIIVAFTYTHNIIYNTPLIISYPLIYFIHTYTPI